MKKNEYVKQIEKMIEYNDYHREDNEEYKERLAEKFKKDISECKYASHMLGYCEQFIHDMKFCELNEAKYGEVCVALHDILNKFEKMEEK